MPAQQNSSLKLSLNSKGLNDNELSLILLTARSQKVIRQIGPEARLDHQSCAEQTVFPPNGHGHAIIKASQAFYAFEEMRFLSLSLKMKIK